jgi:hypothetical protein
MGKWLAAGIRPSAAEFPEALELTTTTILRLFLTREIKSESRLRDF